MRRTVLTVTALLLFWQGAAAQRVPFFEHTTELRHAYALDLVDLHLDILELGVPEDAAANDAAEGEDQAEAEEGEEGLLETALPLMAGTLAEKDEALLGRLEAALTAAEGGDAAAAEEARGLVGEIEGALILEALRGDASFRAARLALLSSLEPGVGEGYEEAAQGETEAYYIGYAGLQRAEAMWHELEGELTGDKENIERAFGVLGALMPSPEPPERFSDPEDAEVAVNDIIFGLEALAGATLIPRDFAAMLATIGAHVSAGCGAAAAGDTRLALEWTTAAAFFYDAYLVDTLQTLAPEPDARISEELGELVDEPGSERTPERCENLSAAFAEASSVFGG